MLSFQLPHREGTRNKYLWKPHQAGAQWNKSEIGCLNIGLWCWFCHQSLWPQRFCQFPYLGVSSFNCQIDLGNHWPHWRSFYKNTCVFYSFRLPAINYLLLSWILLFWRKARKYLSFFPSFLSCLPPQHLMILRVDTYVIRLGHTGSGNHRGFLMSGSKIWWPIQSSPMTISLLWRCPLLNKESYPFPYLFRLCELQLGRDRHLNSETLKKKD